AWIQATGTRGHHLACASKRSSTVICPGNSPKADHELRLKPDYPLGSGQPHLHIARHRLRCRYTEFGLWTSRRERKRRIFQPAADATAAAFSEALFVLACQGCQSVRIRHVALGGGIPAIGYGDRTTSRLGKRPVV